MSYTRKYCKIVDRVLDKKRKQKQRQDLTLRNEIMQTLLWI